MARRLSLVFLKIILILPVMRTYAQQTAPATASQNPADDHRSPKPMSVLVRWVTTGEHTQLHISIGNLSPDCDDRTGSPTFNISVFTEWPLSGSDAVRTVRVSQPVRVVTGKNGTVHLFYGDTGEMAESAYVTFHSVKGSQISGEYAVAKKGGELHGTFVGKQCGQPDGQLEVRVEPSFPLPEKASLKMQIWDAGASIRAELVVTRNTPASIRLSPGEYGLNVSCDLQHGSCGYWVKKKIQVRPGRTTVAVVKLRHKTAP